MSKIKFPQIRKYAVAPEAILDQLIRDSIDAMTTFDTIAQDASDFTNPEKFEAIDAAITKLILKTRIYGIDCPIGANGTTTTVDNVMYSSSEWNNRFNKKIFPDGVEKQDINCRDAHITKATFDYIENPSFLRQFNILYKRMTESQKTYNTALRECMNQIHKMNEDEYDKNSPASASTYTDERYKHTADNARKILSTTKSSMNDPIFNRLRYAKTVMSSIVSLIRVVLNQINSICTEIGSLGRPLVTIGMALSGASLDEMLANM